MYVIGGWNGGYLTNLNYAPLNADGTVGTWSTTTALPAAVVNQSTVTANGYVYSLGGSNSGSAALNTVYYAPLNANGTVGAWGSTTALPVATKYHASIVSNGYVYVFGGKNISNTALKTVYYAPLNANGTIGAWTATTAMPGLMGYANAVIANGYVYVIGSGIVYYAPLNADGTVGAWTTGTAMPLAVYFNSIIAVNGYVYVAGGEIVSTHYNTVYYAPLNADGTVGAWSTTTVLPQAMISHASVFANGNMYVIGGYSSAYLNTVYSSQVQGLIPTCTVTLTPNPSPYAYTGTPVTVTWSSTNATQVQINNVGLVAPSGSSQVASQTNGLDYSCYGYNSVSALTGPWYNFSLAVTSPPAPQVSISASSTNIVTGSSTNITADFAAGSGQTVAPTSTTIYLTSGSTWTVPSNWNSFNNSIEVIAAGGGGYTSTAGGGGGGGAYSKVSNVALTPGSTVTFNVGLGGAAATAGADSYFCNAILNCASIAGTAVVVGAKGGGSGSSNTSTFATGFNGLASSITIDSSGNLYIADISSIYKIASSGSVATLASDSNSANSVILDSSGNLYVGNQGNNTVTKITSGGTASTFASGLNGPIGFAFDSSGNLYVGNYSGNTVSKITSAGSVSTFASGMNGPQALAFDSAGNLYVANANGNTISKVTPSKVVSTFASGMNSPTNLAFDSSGNLYVANAQGNTISKITSGGTVSTFASGLNEPFDLVFDSSGNLYATNEKGNTVSEITPSGTVSTFASNLNAPEGLVFDSFGNLYVGNAGNNTISKIPASTSASGGQSSSGIGSVKYSGGNGGASGGGGGAGPLSAGGNGGTLGGSAGGGSWTGYAPGAGGASGIAGLTYGGGGGNNSGAGAPGLIVITYYPITANGTDSLTADNINGDTGNPSGWTGGLGATTNPDSSKTITFTPTSTGTYTFYAMAQTGYFSSWTNYAPLTITVAPGPSCTVSANPSTITTYQGSATLSWNSSNASSFSLQNYSGSVPVVDDTPNSDTVTPSQTTTYSGTAIGSGVTTTCSATLTLACTPTYICSGQQVESVNSSCQTTNYGSPCTSPGYCVGGDSYCYYSQADFPPGNGQSSGDLTLRPSLVPKGGNIKIYWNVLPDSAKSCTVTGSNNDGTITSTDTASPGIWNTYTGSMISSSIQQQTTYTLSCLQDDGATYKTETQTVNIVPSYQER